MKIALFHNLPTGGAKRVVYYQAQLLQKSHSVDIYTIDDGSHDFLPWENLEGKIYRYPFSLSSSLQYIPHRFIEDYKKCISLKSLQKRIAQDIEKKQYDFVLVHPDRYTQSPFLLQFLSLPSAYYCHELLRIAYESQFAFTDSVPFYKKMYEYCSRKLRKHIDYTNAQYAKAIFSNSQYTKNNIEKHYHKPACVCYPGVDSHIFKPLKKNKTVDILFVGDPSPYEGYDFFQDSLHYIQKKPSVKILSKRTTNMWISDSDLSKEYNQAKIIVATAVHEPFGLIPLEAAACGVPVVAVNDGGYTETVVDGKTGFLVERNSQMFAQAIESLLKSESLRQKMGEKARFHITKNWTWEKRIQELEHQIIQCKK